MRYFFIDPSLVTGPEVSITGSEVHHIKNVLRLKAGDGLKLFDGTGFEYEAAIVRLSAKKVTVEIQRKARAAAPSGVQIIVAQAFLKQTTESPLPEVAADRHRSRQAVPANRYPADRRRTFL